MKIVIPSRGRSDIVGAKALKLVPDALVCVGADEADNYRRVTKNLLVHPTDVIGIGPKRQWILDNVDDPVVVMVDDDMESVYSNVGFRRRKITDPRVCQAIIERVAIMAEDMQVGVFGFWQAAFTRYYANFKPFSLNTWVGGVIGIRGRELRYDPKLLLRADIDFCLQSLMRHRIMLMDCRYRWFGGLAFEGKGGGARVRSLERHQTELAYLQRKWGQYLEVVQEGQMTRLVIDVQR